MGNEKNCDSVISEMLSDFADLSPEALAHVESCKKCKAELEKIKKLDALLESAAPAVPSMKDAVLSKIERENISPAPVTSPRRHIPFGTIAAAAAVFAVGILVYKGDILDKVNNVEKGSDMIYVADLEAAEEEASDVLDLSCDSAQGIFLAAPETDKAPTVMYSKDETDDVTESVEAEAENTAPEEHKSLQSAKPENAEDEKSNGIVEKDHLLSTAPPHLTDGGKNTVSPLGRDNVSDKSEVDGTQGINDAANEDVRAPLSDKTGETTAAFDPTGTDTGTGAGAGRGSSGGASMGGGGVAKAPDDPKYDEFEEDDVRLQTTTFDFNAFLSKITKDSDAAEIYKVLSQFYPDAISYETFENSDPDEYLAFVMSIEDFESEYTESAFLSFCGKILFVGYKNTEVL
ncbi:MAG: hypothetical protein E7656_02880 [Ruminococcaceae bacterium]|nr:hypothetical protein [Oscillospiraceae bacterium]